MPRLSKYDRLRRWLQSVTWPEITVSFADIEKVLGFPLPESAYKYDSWWANSTAGSHMKAWRDAGWMVEKVERSARRVTFRRVRGAPTRPVNAAEEGGARPQTAGKTGEGDERPATADDKEPLRESSMSGQDRATDADTQETRPAPAGRSEDRERAAAAVEAVISAMPQELVDVRRLPPQARRLLELRARRHGRTLSRELLAIVAEAVAAERRLLLEELERLREATQRPGGYDLLELLERRG